MLDRSEDQPVAVIIGAASGIGAALAKQALGRGYRLALADAMEIPVELDPAISAQLDVRDSSALAAFAGEVFDRLGRVDLLFNNAGIMRPGRLWEQPEEHMRAVMDVNLGGVINGVRAFLPRMIENGLSARVVNTASLAGLVAAPGLSAYCISKHGVVALSETLAIDLQMAGHPISVSVVCPSAVSTNIMASATEALTGAGDAGARAVTQQMAEGMKRVGASPEQAADAVFKAIDEDKFWIRPLDEPMAPVIRRAGSIEGGAAPRFTGWDT